jgi:5'(3')-deoxyribonucleotidase
MAQIQNVTDYEIVTDNGLNEEDFNKPQLKNYLKENQSSPTSADISKEYFKYILTQVIKNKYSC